MHPSDETGPAAAAPCAAASPCVPKVHRCRKGHLMTYVSPKGKRLCGVCRKQRLQRQRALYEPVRQARLRARRARIAAGPRHGRTVRIWAAGHFEGEGTFSIVHGGGKNGTQPFVSLSSTDKSMVDVFHDHWPGCMRLVPPRNPRERVQFNWSLRSLDRIEGFILDVRPFLRSERVRERQRCSWRTCGRGRNFGGRMRRGRRRRRGTRRCGS